MPHKRKKRSERNNIVNQTLSYNESPDLDKLPDTPRGFSRILRAKEIREEKFGEKRSSSSSTIDKRKSKQHPPSLQRLNNETFAYSSRRIGGKMRSDILKSIKEGTSTKIKKKRSLEKLKQKRKAKEMKLLKESGVKDFDSFQDHVKFGEVVKAPPSITAIPKQRGSAELMKKINNDGFDSNKHPKNNKKDSKNKNPAIKRILSVERERAIAQYRMVKSNKI